MTWGYWKKAMPAQLAEFVSADAARFVRVRAFDADVTDDLMTLVEEAYDSLCSCDIAYSLEPYSHTAEVQAVRSPEQIAVVEKKGTCLDLSLFLAGVCLAKNLLPVIMAFGDDGVESGHVLVAISLANRLREFSDLSRDEAPVLNRGLVTDFQVVQKLVLSGQYIAVEATFVSSNLGTRPRTFKEAIVAATQRCQESGASFQFAIDIASAHHLWGITPQNFEPARNESISFEEFHDRSMRSIEKQVASIAGDKLLPDLYVHRSEQKEILRFLHSESIAIATIERCVLGLQKVASRYSIPVDDPTFKDAKECLQRFGSKDQAASLVALRDLFFVDTIQNAESLIHEIISEDDDKRANRLSIKLQKLLENQRFIPPADAIAELKSNLIETRTRTLLKGTLPSRKDRFFNGLLEVLPSIDDDNGQLILASDLVYEIHRAITEASSHCQAVVGRAGVGKTSMLCNIAKEISGKWPVLVMSAEREVSGSNDLQELIGKAMESAYGREFSTWISRTGHGLGSVQGWFVVILDGINEARDLVAIIRGFRQWLPQLQFSRVKFIVSCRDVLWSYFEGAVIEHIAFQQPIFLSGFDEQEQETALTRYFDEFSIRNITLGTSARRALRNPLLLRVFCEAHEGADGGVFLSLQTPDVFGDYLDRLASSAAEKLEHRSSNSLIVWIVNVASMMWCQRTRLITAELIDDQHEKLGSVYERFLDANVLIERKDETDLGVKCQFLYDEIFEYLIARSWHASYMASREKEKWLMELLDEVVDTFMTFEASFGAMLFFSRFEKSDATILEKFIARLSSSPDLIKARQEAILGIVKSLPNHSIQEGVAEFVILFESVASERIKGQLGDVLTWLFRNSVGRDVERFAERVLEINRTERSLVAYHAPMEADWLPPARFHYVETAKRAALSFLALNDARSDPSRVDGAVFRSALQALAELDESDDETVLRFIDRFYTHEDRCYRVFCAWLLRSRFGSKPASVLARLLSDTDTRVHKYVYRMLTRTRMIERCLVETLIREASGESSPWHLRQYLTILSHTENFDAPVESKKLVKVLVSHLSHERPDIRKEAAWALSRHCEPLEFRQRLQKTKDAQLLKLLQVGYFS